METRPPRGPVNRRAPGFGPADRAHGATGGRISSTMGALRARSPLEPLSVGPPGAGAVRPRTVRIHWSASMSPTRQPETSPIHAAVHAASTTTSPQPRDRWWEAATSASATCNADGCTGGELSGSVALLGAGAGEARRAGPAGSAERAARSGAPRAPRRRAGDRVHRGGRWRRCTAGWMRWRAKCPWRTSGLDEAPTPVCAPPFETTAGRPRHPPPAPPYRRFRPCRHPRVPATRPLPSVSATRVLDDRRAAGPWLNVSRRNVPLVRVSIPALSALR